MILSARLHCNIIVALWFRIVTTLFQHYCPNNVSANSPVKQQYTSSSLPYIIRGKLRCHSLYKGKRAPFYSRSFPKGPSEMPKLSGPALNRRCMAKKSGDINVLNKYSLSKMTICVVSCCPQLKFFAYSECMCSTYKYNENRDPTMRQAVAFKSLKTMENYKNITSKVATVAYYMRGGCLRDVRTRVL